MKTQASNPGTTPPAPNDEVGDIIEHLLAEKIRSGAQGAFSTGNLKGDALQELKDLKETVRRLTGELQRSKL